MPRVWGAYQLCGGKWRMGTSLGTIWGQGKGDVAVVLVGTFEDVIDAGRTFGRLLIAWKHAVQANASETDVSLVAASTAFGAFLPTRTCALRSSCSDSAITCSGAGSHGFDSGGFVWTSLLPRSWVDKRSMLLSR